MAAMGVANLTDPLLFPTREQKEEEEDKEVEDYCDQTSVVNGISLWRAVVLLLATTIGAGVTALPSTLNVLGLVPGTVCILLGAFLSSNSLNIMLTFRRNPCSDSYASILDTTFGRYSKIFVRLCVLINITATLALQVILIDMVLFKTSTDSMGQGVLERWLHGSSLSLLSLRVGVFVLLCLFSFIQHKDCLFIFSLIAVGLALIFVVVNTGILAMHFLEGSLPKTMLIPVIPNDINSMGRLLAVVPIVTTPYVRPFSVHIISSKLQNPNLMNDVVKRSLKLGAFAYVWASFCGFILFGSSIQNNLVANFANLESYLLFDSIRIMYTIHLLLVFPNIFNAIRPNVDDLFPHTWSNLVNNIVMVFVVMLFVILAILVPSLWNIFQILRLGAAVGIAFYFPAQISERDGHGRAKKILYWAIALLGFIGSLIVGLLPL